MSVRVPRVAINIDLGEGNRIGDVSLLAVGYSFRQAWIYATIFSSLSIFGINPASTGVLGTSASVAGFISIVVFAIALLFAGFTDQHFLHFYTDRKTLVGGAVLTCIGTLLLLIPGDSGPNVLLAAEIVSGICTGLGTGTLIVFWGIAFARQNAVSVIIDTAVAVVLGLLIFTFVICKLPAPFGGVLCALLPLIELGILFKLTPISFAKENRVPIFKPLPVYPHKFARHFIPCVFFFGAALGIMRHVSIQYIVPDSVVDNRLIIIAASCVVALLVLLTLAATSDEGIGWTRTFRIVVPLIAVAIVFLPYISDDSTILAECVVLCGYLMFEMIMWSFFGIMSQRYRLSPVLVYGFGRGTLSFAASIGAIVIMQVGDLASLGNAPASNEMLVAIVLLLVVFLAYILMPNQRTIESTINMKPPVHMQAKNFYEGSTSNLEELTRPNIARPAAVRPTFIKVNTAEGTMTEGRVDLEAAAATAAELEAVAAAQQEASSLTVPPAQERVVKAPVPESVPQAPRGAAEAALATETAATLKKGAGSLTDKPEETVVSLDERLARECEKVANTYLLSRRETEVCFFLARGHNSSYIQEKLYISEGTAKTHIRHIYRKLDIHSQEELIRLVEEADTMA